MSSVVARSSTPGGVRVRVSLLVMAAVAVVTAIFDVVGRPHGGTARLDSTRDYAFTSLLLPFVVAMFGVLAALRAAQRGQGGNGGRLGEAGFVAVTAGLLAFAVCGAVTLATGDPESTGPLYPVAMLATLVGLVLMSIRWVRGRTSPRWMLPVLTLGWIFGGPVAESGELGFRGAALILAAVCVIAAVATAAPSPREADSS